MDKATVRNNQFDILLIFNPSSQPYEVRYNSEIHKIIPPGKAARIVRMIAGDQDHGNVKHLIDRMCRQQGVPLNADEVRSKWREKIVLEEQTSSMPTIPTEVDLAKQVQDKVNKNPITEQLPNVPTPQVSTNNSQWKYDPMTGKPIVKTETTGITPDQVKVDKIEVEDSNTNISMPESSVNPPPHPDEETNNILSSLRSSGEERVIEQKETDSEEKPVADEKKPEKTTREELMTFARTIMAVDDPKTKATLDAMSDEQLAKELKYNEVA